MNILIGFMFSMLIFFSLDVRAEKKSVGRQPGSFKTIKDMKKSPDKKIKENYAEHLFNQAMENPASIKNLDF